MHDKPKSGKCRTDSFTESVDKIVNKAGINHLTCSTHETFFTLTKN